MVRSGSGGKHDRGGEPAGDGAGDGPQVVEASVEGDDRAPARVDGQAQAMRRAHAAFYRQRHGRPPAATAGRENRIGGITGVRGPAGDDVARPICADHQPAVGLGQAQTGAEGDRRAPAAAGRVHGRFHDGGAGRARPVSPHSDRLPGWGDRHGYAVPGARRVAALAQVRRLPGLPVRAGAHLDVRGAVGGREGPAGRHGPVLADRHRVAARPRQRDRR